MTLEDLQVGAGDDIWGIAADGSVTVGYDSGVDKVEPGHRVPEWADAADYEPLPTAEKLRLADMMIERWTRYRTAVLEKV